MRKRTLLPIALLLTSSVACVAVHAQQASSTLIQSTKVVRAPIGRLVRAYGVAGSCANSTIDINVGYAARVQAVHVVAGQAVKQGQPLFTVAADPAARLAYQQAVSAARLARGELARMQALFAQQLASASQLATAQEAAADAEHAVQAQTALGASAATRVIVSPSAGAVLDITAQTGVQMPPGASLATLAAQASGAQHECVTLALDPAEMSNLSPGEAVRFASLNTPPQGRQTVTGRIASVGAAIDPHTRMVNVSAMLDRGNFLYPGTPVAATIEFTPTLHWVVPRSAVLQDASGGAYVFQVRQGLAHRVSVSIFADNGQTIGVDGALDAALSVVTVGNYELKDGAAVREGTQ